MKSFFNNRKSNSIVVKFAFIGSVKSKVRAILSIINSKCPCFFEFNEKLSDKEEILKVVMLETSKQLNARYLISDSVMTRIEKELKKDSIKKE